MRIGIGREVEVSTTLSAAAYLTTPYQPVAIYYHESDSVEYVRHDAPCLYRRIDDFLTLILDTSTREIIGFRLKGFRNFYLRHLEKVLRRFDTDFLALVSVVEEHVKAVGDDAFDVGRREAYSAAREIALNDKVRLDDLPQAA